MDVPRSFALAVLAIIAVAPEYAVNALYAWDAEAFAGMQQGEEAANLAVTNMTGANRMTDPALNGESETMFLASDDF